MNRNYKKENMMNAGDINKRVYNGKFGEFYDVWIMNG